MKMSEFFELRLEEVCPSKPVSWYSWPWVAAHGSKVSMAVSTLVAVLVTIDCFTKTSYLDASLGIRFITGIFSCVWAQGFYVFDRPLARHTFSLMASVARNLEATAKADGDFMTQAGLERVAGRCHRLLRVVSVYACMVVVSVLLPTLVAGQPSMPTWPRPASTAAPTAVLLPTLAVQVVTGVCCPIAFYTLLGLIGCTHLACAELYRGMGAVVQRARGEAQLRDFARHHVLLSEATSRLDELTTYMVHFLMTAVMLLPIQGTYDAVQGRVDAYLLSSAPIILVVFVPLSFSGQALSDASELVGLRAYQGAWPEEDTRARFVRTMVMVRSAKPAQFSCRGLGAIGLPACESVLKSWFSYLQMLLNVTRKSKPA